MTEQKITIPDNMELVKVNETEYKIVEKKKELPKTWEEFCDKYPYRIGEDYYIDENSNIKAMALSSDRGYYSSRNTLPNKDYAEAILALCQLIQLRDCYRQGWKPDWSDLKSKQSVKFRNGKIVIAGALDYHHILTFQSEELTREFINNFRDLIEKTKPLFM